jgi:hypothetical protein
VADIGEATEVENRPELIWWAINRIGGQEVFGRQSPSKFAFDLSPPPEYDPSMSSNGLPSCVSCGCEITVYRRGHVSPSIDCCQRCWVRMPVADRLKIAVSLRDREPGGFLNELAQALSRIEQPEDHLG